jgi:hypothetical protein
MMRERERERERERIENTLVNLVFLSEINEIRHKFPPSCFHLEFSSIVLIFLLVGSVTWTARRITWGSWAISWRCWTGKKQVNFD